MAQPKKCTESTETVAGCSKSEAESPNTRGPGKFKIVRDIREGNSTPDEAKQLMWYFPDLIKASLPRVLIGERTPEETRQLMFYYVDLVESGAAPPQDLNDWVAKAFRQFLAGEATLPKALGLTGRQGAPRSRADRDGEIAADVLSLLLRGKTLRFASTSLQHKYSVRSNKIQDIWAANKLRGLIIIIERRRTNTPREKKCSWSPSEVRLLQRLYKKEVAHYKGKVGRDMLLI